MEVNTLYKQDFMAGGGEMGALIRSIDWSTTPVGDPLQWPQSLRTALSIMLENAFPMSIVWGPSWIQFYNDAYRPILGATKHPTAMGNSIPETFSEIWDIIEPLFREVMRGQAVRFSTFQLLLNRYGYTEECYFDFSYSPIRDESGGVGGILATVVETTEKVIAERRLKTLRDLSERASEAMSMKFAREGILLSLEENVRDIPFALYYELDEEGHQVHLAGAIRISDNHLLAKSSIALQETNDTIWPFTTIIQTGHPQLVTGLDRFATLPGGEWNEVAHSAYVVPVNQSDKEHPFGILVLGISPRKAFDESYKDFFTLLTGHVSAAFARALAWERESWFRHSELAVRESIREELEKRVAERTFELSRKNEELRRSEERYLRMTNEVEDYAIILLSSEGLIENWNKGAEKIKGYTADEIIGKHFRIFYTEEDKQHQVPEGLINEAVLKGKAYFEGWRVRKDGSTVWASTVITALHDEQNDIIGFSKVTRDLTERKISEDTLKMYAEQLEMKNRELERSNSELTSFSYVASHDLQEPLRKIQAFGNLIMNKDAENLSDISKDYFDRMVKAAIRMQNLIDSLLEFSRTTTARKNFEETDLNKLLDEVKKELADRIEEKKAIIHTGDLPVLTVIPFQFRQLLFNLLNNSLKYARDEEPPVIDIMAEKIRAKHMKEKAAQAGLDYYKFSVVDNGIGFEQEYAEKVFELFQRLHGRNEYSGSGIGLAICKKIVENHHGFIRAESEPGKGAAFYFFIPVKKGEDA